MQNLMCQAIINLGSPTVIIPFFWGEGAVIKLRLCVSAPGALCFVLVRRFGVLGVKIVPVWLENLSSASVKLAVSLFGKRHTFGGFFFRAN